MMGSFEYVSNGLNAGDLYVNGARSYADYCRTELLSWDECQDLMQVIISVKLGKVSSAFPDLPPTIKLNLEIFSKLSMMTSILSSRKKPC